MTTHRLDRRIAVLKGKREGAFDRGQYWFEAAPRQRAARRVKTLLRHMDPVYLSTPRWSQVARFLDDIAVELKLGRPAIEAHVLPLAAVQGKSALQAWGWVMQRFLDLCGLPFERRMSQAVSRDGFRTLFAQLLNNSKIGPRRVLMLHGLESVHLDALRDLLDVFEGHAIDAGPDRRLNLLIAGSVEVPHLGAAIERVALPDYGTAEAMEAVVEIAGPLPVARLEKLVASLAGVPALLERVAAEGPAAIEEAAGNREGAWRRLGPLGAEVRSAFAIVAADNALSQRIEAIAKEGPVPEDPARDSRLLRAGLIQHARGGGQPHVQIRAPVFADLTAMLP